MDISRVTFTLFLFLKWRVRDHKDQYQLRGHIYKLVTEFIKSHQVFADDIGYYHMD